MTVPGRLTLLSAAILAAVLLAAIVEPPVAVGVLAADLSLLLICLAQGRQLARLPVDVQRDRWGRAQVGTVTQFSYRISNRSRKEVVVRVRQPWPVGVDAETEVFEVRVSAGEVVRAALQGTPTARGTIGIPLAEIELRPAWTGLAIASGLPRPR